MFNMNCLCVVNSGSLEQSLKDGLQKFSNARRYEYWSQYVKSLVCHVAEMEEEGVGSLTETQMLISAWRMLLILSTSHVCYSKQSLFQAFQWASFSHSNNILNEVCIVVLNSCTQSGNLNVIFRHISILFWKTFIAVFAAFMTILEEGSYCVCPAKTTRVFFTSRDLLGLNHIFNLKRISVFPQNIQLVLICFLTEC